MSEGGGGCCLGREIVGDQTDLPQESVWDACRVGIKRAIQKQLDKGSSPVVIDGLPTIGKTKSAAEVVTEFDQPAAIFTHLHDTRNAHLESIVDDDVDVIKLPSLETDCPTATGEHGDEWANRLKGYHNRGASPKFLHMRLQDDLPCMQDDECEYIKRWNEASNADLLIGHPVHAGLPEVVEDRIVVFDEDPQDAFRTEFSASDLAPAIATFLEKQDIQIDTLSELEIVAKQDRFNSVCKELREVVTDGDNLTRPAEALNENGGHANAPVAILAILEFDGLVPESQSDEEADPDWNSELRDRIKLDYVQLIDGSEAVFDYREDSLYLRSPPDLSTACAIVGLDGTPTKAIWSGRLGVESVSVQRILCDDCRQQYLQETIGYQFVQTSRSINPYSSGRHANRRECYGLIEAVANRHGTEVPIITTKKAENRLFENETSQPFIDTQRVENSISNFDHYGNLRSSNKFEGEEVGIVLGSPHPGDRAIQVTAAFEGYIAERGDEKGASLAYGLDGDPFLQHYRENKVAQAIFRFGRTVPSTAYVHTSALPDWLQEIAISPDDAPELEIVKRSEGERAVMYTLEEEGPGTVQEITARESIDFSENHVRDMLKRLRREGIVTRNDTQPYTWNEDGVSDPPHTASVTLPDLS
ncbi:hypothetical protein [Natrialba sp. INN-245]|uniref:hypothetical protein n=1 Tax=Natrialba sp. INN-245 TaxID=2690967 RepID=UPI001310B755|nr:hypothetical protein [Natrialba sp. INN-245]MWV38875.1 hypothetical protein [Natrialba sp. INN-245]